MGAFKGDVKTAVDAGGLNNAVLNGLIDARVKAILDSYTIGGSSETSGSTLEIGAAIPKGARVVAIVIHVSAAQTSATLSIGDNASATRYASADTGIQTAGVHIFSGKNYKTGQSDGDTQILLTTGGATLTSGQLETAVLYTMD